ncbi:hypothetical protein BSFA1_10990 [Burkholderia sp. SFA1]|nr:hypothetical protein BSFA1_10990 [Burkholderia sp. SFA1]
MATLQKVNLGTPPTAVDGDTVRGANTKANSNVDVLNVQAALTSAPATITAAQALTAAHVGKRVNINLAAPSTINVPSAATMGLDGIVHLRNTGTTLVTLAIATGSGDTLALTKLNGGESAVLDSDGTHAIGCLMRGRTNADNEVVNGDCVVGGNETVAGTLAVGDAATLSSTLAVTGATTLASTLAVTGAATLAASLAVKGTTTFGAGTTATISAAGAYSGTSGTFSGLVQAARFKTSSAAQNADITSQGLTVSWNDNSAGAAQLTNNIGGGSGIAYVLRSLNAAGTTELMRVTIGNEGNVITGGTVQAIGWLTRFGLTGAQGTNKFNVAWSSPTAYLYIDSTNIGAIASTSDRRVKHQISDYADDALAQAKALRVVNFRYADVGIFKDTGEVHIGFVADEVQDVIQDAVTGDRNAVDEAGEVQPQLLKPIPLIAIAIGAIQKLEARIAELEAKAAA